MQTKEKVIAKFDIPVIDTPEADAQEETLQTVEIEVLPPVDVTDQRKLEIYNGITEIDKKLAVISGRIDELNAEIDSLTNHADGIDYAIAVASGIVAGIIDSLWVGEFSVDRANQWGNDKTNDFVVKIAKSQGYKGDDIEGAIQFLERKYPIAADKATNDFGGGRQHHLRDFSHHPTPVGMFFSLLTQFTEKAYGTDVAGVFKIVPVEAGTLIGENLPEKITFGVVHWFFHMVSDIAGSSTAAGNGSVGTGLPGPLVSLLKEISALPIFKKMNKDGYKEFSVWIAKLFNGTLLGKRDENGKLVEAVKFDLRTEIGVVREIGRQAVPVIINECVVRGFYFIRRLYKEIKENDIKSISDFKNINWKNTLPFNNRTVVRMLTIATGTFVAFDVADAAIRSGGFNSAGNLRINFVGIGRFAVAIGTDIVMGVKKWQKEQERNAALSEYIQLANIKIYYRQADVLCSLADTYEREARMYAAEGALWYEVKNTAEAMQQLYEQIYKTYCFYTQAIAQMDACLDDMKDAMATIEQRFPGLRAKMQKRLK